MVNSDIVDFLDRVHAATWVFILVFILGATTAAIKTYRTIRPFFRSAGDFFDDWRGVPDRPGQPGNKGAMERIQLVENQLKKNGGFSLKDQTNRLEKNQQLMVEQVNTIGLRLGVTPMEMPKGAPDNGTT